MKRKIVLSMAMAMMIGLAACGSGGGTPAAAPDKNVSQETSESGQSDTQKSTEESTVESMEESSNLVGVAMHKGSAALESGRGKYESSIGAGWLHGRFTVCCQ